MNHYRRQTDLQRAPDVHINEMHQDNTRTSQISKTYLGTKTRSAQHHLQRSHLAPYLIRCAGLDRGHGEEMQYTRVQRLMNIKIAKAYITTSGEALSVLNGITPKLPDYTVTQETDTTIN